MEEAARKPLRDERPRFLLREMRSACASSPNMWKWTLPAWAGKMDADGRNYNACPSAGICKDLCFARHGTFKIPSTRQAHQRNLRYVMDDLAGWEQQLTEELHHRRYQRPKTYCRIHDSGDFYSPEYLHAWLRIIRAHPAITFYAYTKQIAEFKEIVCPDPPPNFHWRFGYGGTQDHLIEPGDPHVDVFPTNAALEEAGYTSQEPSDLLAIYAPETLGIPANNHRHLKKRQGAHTFRALQRAADEKAAQPRAKRRGPASTRPGAKRRT